jgi:hypothetical protein
MKPPKQGGFLIPERRKSMELYEAPSVEEVFKKAEQLVENRRKFKDYESYVCWILSRKRYGRNKKYRHKG